MALMLRKHCQQILNKFDLDAYHVDLDANQKTFKLYTPCGKTFAVVSGVLFGSLHPTKAEIEFAGELLEHWLARNQTIIDEYLKAFTKLQLLGAPPSKKDGMSINTVWSTNSKDICARFESGGAKYDVTADGELADISFKNPRESWNFSLPAKKKAAAMAFARKHVEYAENEKVVERILSEMNTCSDM